MLPQCLLLCFRSIQHGSAGDVENVMLTTDGQWTADGRKTDNRPLHKLTWSKALGELTRNVHTKSFENLTAGF